MRPFFTVAIPTFNRAQLLKSAIRSVLSQTCGDFELLISDNASADGTGEVVNRISDQRVKYFRQEQNMGAVGNFEFLLSQASGTFFVVVQDDDLLHEEFLERCHRFVGSRTDISLFAGAVLWGNSPEGVPGVTLDYRESPLQTVDCTSNRPAEIPGIDAALMQLFGLPFIHPGIALRTDALRETGGFKTEIGYASDNLVLARVALRGSVLFDLRVSAFLRRHEGNYSLAFSRKNRLASRRRANELILHGIEAVEPGWPGRVGPLLKCLTRRRRWRLLAENWEGNYPRPLRSLLAESLVGASPLRKTFVHLAAIVWKAKIPFVVLNHLVTVGPKV